jgi:hypothetical protein
MEIRQEGSRLLGTHQPAAVARVSAAGSEFAAANLAYPIVELFWIGVASFQMATSSSKRLATSKLGCISIEETSARIPPESVSFTDKVSLSGIRAA